MRLNTAILTSAAFLFAAAFSLLMALFVGSALESRSARHVTRALANAGLPWVEVSADGLLVSLHGTAPTEAMRFRAATVAGSVIGTNRVLDRMEVTPAKALTVPRFSLEFLRNDDGISMIGLVPSSWETEVMLGIATQLAPDDALTNMIETSDFALPDTWQEAVDFGLVALRLLPRSKISVAADGVQVTAISDSPAQKRRLETELGRVLPANVPVRIDISAPRPVIAPFTLRFVVDETGPRFDACAADSDRARNRIVAAARRGGLTGTPACTLGLGSPSPRWAEAAEAVIAAMAELGAGSVTISDVDVTLIADATVAQADFDRVVGELTAKLPDVFSLKSTLTPRPQESAEGPAQFSATLSPEGAVQLRGRLTDERQRDAVEAYARARFGASNVYVATRLDDSLPGGWGVRVLAGLSSLAELNSGALLVEPERVALRGLTGNQGARAEVARLLSDRLGQGAGFSVDVTYEERLDPNRALPTPEQCLARASKVLERRQISFAPGSADLEGDAMGVIAMLVDALEDCRETPLEIGGHTDSQGRAETNLRLSQQRADAVLIALTAAGADTIAMTARGYGAAEPIADNSTEEGRETNRRIALTLVAETDEAEAEETPPEDLPAAIAPPPPRPDDLAVEEDELPEEEGGEPMGEAGDLDMGDEDFPPEDDAEEPTEAPDTDAEDQSEASETGAEDADTPPADEAGAEGTGEADEAADAGTDAAEAAPAEAEDAPETGTEAAPETDVPAEADDPTEADAGPPGAEAAADWQDDPDHNSLRPQRRPEEAQE